jgi:hypothetical protein
VDEGGIEYDEETKTVRFPPSVLQSEMSSRRTKMVLFTCNKCGRSLAPMHVPVPVCVCASVVVGVGGSGGRV